MESNTKINASHIAGVWSGVIFLAFYLLGLWIFSNYVPAHPPSWTADQISQVYAENRFGIQAGMVLIMFASGFYLAWTVMWSSHIKNMEQGADFLSNCQLIGGVASSMFFILPALFWQVAAYRTENSPEIVLLLNDIGWILTVTPVPPFLVQFIPLGAAILSDRRQAPDFPRWFGFATLWACLLYSPAVIAYFFKGGPFAWDGLFSFWIPLSVFVVWMLTAFVLSRKATKRYL